MPRCSGIYRDRKRTLRLLLKYIRFCHIVDLLWTRSMTDALSSVDSRRSIFREIDSDWDM
jgi:hypothetical protein